MKKTLLAFALVAFSAISLRADIVSQTLNIEGFGDNGDDASTPELVASLDFTLPDIDSLDSVGVQLAHSYGSDITLELIAPTGAIFMIVEGQGGGPSPHQGGFNATQLGDGGGFLLANIVDYTIVENGTMGTNWLASGDPLAAGAYDQRLVSTESWATGSFLAGSWTLNLYDSWDTVDRGSVGNVSLGFSPTAIPEPSTLGCMAIALMALAITRRRRD